MSIEAGNFGVILNYKERPIGSYPVTIATLRLFLQLLQGIGFLQEREEQQVNFLDLSACEVFILREVFSGFHKWRFTKIEDREQIGENYVPANPKISNSIAHYYYYYCCYHYYYCHYYCRHLQQC